MNDDRADQILDLAAEMDIPESDLYLIGDGSGTGAKTPCGWFVTAYDHVYDLVSEHIGGTNGGTNNLAELAPYIHALWWHHTMQEEPPTQNHPCRVVIISDSEVTVRCGKREYGRKANLCLWAAIDWFEQNGYRLSWFWVPRNSNPFSSRADSEAGRLRKLLVGETSGSKHV